MLQYQGIDFHQQEERSHRREQKFQSYNEVLTTRKILGERHHRWYVQETLFLWSLQKLVPLFCTSFIWHHPILYHLWIITFGLNWVFYDQLLTKELKYSYKFEKRIKVQSCAPDWPYWACSNDLLSAHFYKVQGSMIIYPAVVTVDIRWFSCELSKDWRKVNGTHDYIFIHLGCLWSFTTFFHPAVFHCTFTTQTVSFSAKNKKINN